MKSKTLFSAVLVILMAVAFMFSPFGMNSAVERLQETKLAETKMGTYKQNLNTMEHTLSESVDAYNDSRDFDVFYGDIENIVKIFSGLSGVEVQSVTVVDPMDYYRDVMPWSAGVDCAAVRFELLVADASNAINALTRMQLPVQSLYVEFPNTVNVTIVTGGAV